MWNQELCGLRAVTHARAPDVTQRNKRWTEKFRKPRSCLISTARPTGSSSTCWLGRCARCGGDRRLNLVHSSKDRERAGAYRVYEDPAELLKHIDEVGGRR